MIKWANVSTPLLTPQISQFTQATTWDRLWALHIHTHIWKNSCDIEDLVKHHICKLRTYCISMARATSCIRPHEEYVYSLLMERKLTAVEFRGENKRKRNKPILTIYPGAFLHPCNEISLKKQVWLVYVLDARHHIIQVHVNWYPGNV